MNKPRLMAWLLSTTLASLLAGLFVSQSALAQYKYVGPDGKITYSDVPPPAPAKVLSGPSHTTKQLKYGNATPDTEEKSSYGNLPYPLAQSSKNFSVVLYTRANCIPCDDGRALLQRRGIPFQEKTVANNEDLASLKAQTGDTGIPVLKVGSSTAIGFEPSTWDNSLDLAGYPKTSQLPGNYRAPAATSAAPSQVKVMPEAKADEPQKYESAPAQPAGNAPPGFKF